MERFVIRDREAGNPIDSFSTFEEAKNAFRQFVESDKLEGIYEASFYEIIDTQEDITYEESDL